MASRREQMEQRAWEFHLKHPEVWELFVKFTHQLIRRGFRKYGAKAVMERIRWEVDEAGGDGLSTWKIANNHTAFYARWYAATYPAHADFFRFRRQTSEDRAAWTRPELQPRDYPDV